MIALFGGSFDPVHNAHIIVARTVLEQLAASEVRFIPCKKNVLKNIQPTAPEHRLNMLQLAIQHQPKFIVDPIELQREGKSYTVDTLRSIRKKVGDHVPLSFILGADAYQGIHAWYKSEQILTLCHLIVVNRSRVNQTQQPAGVDRQALHQQSHGLLYYLQMPPIDLSSTATRQKIKAHIDFKSDVPAAVYNYIMEHRLYV